MNQKFQSNYMILLVLLMSLSFSVAFGHDYSKKVITVAFVVWLFTVKKEDFIAFFTNKIIIVLLLFIILHYISLFWSEHLAEGLYYNRDFIRYLFIPLLMIATVIKQEHIKYIIGAFVAGMFVNEIISYLIYFDLYETEYSKIHRYPVGFINHIPYSVLVSFSAILILFQAQYIKNKYIKIIYLIFFVTMTTNLVISSGRTGYVVYFASLIILLFTYYKLSLKNFLQLLLFPTLVFLVAYKLNEDVQKRVEASLIAVDKINQSANYQSSFGARLSVYPLVNNIMNQEHNNVLLGVGTGDIEKELNDAMKRVNFKTVYLQHTHNSYIEAYLNAGVLGILLLILYFIMLWKIKLKDKELVFIKQLFIVTFTIAILSDQLLHLHSTMLFFGIFSAMLISQERHESLVEK